MDETFSGLGVNQAMTGYDSPKMVRMPTMKERLAMAVEQAEKQLADAQRAQEIFTKNPELEELLNIMQRSRF